DVLCARSAAPQGAEIEHLQLAAGGFVVHPNFRGVDDLDILVEPDIAIGIRRAAAAPSLRIADPLEAQIQRWGGPGGLLGLANERIGGRFAAGPGSPLAVVRLAGERIDAHRRLLWPGVSG